MKPAFIKSILVLSLLFIVGSIIAQPPPAIPLQAIAKDPLGNPAKNRKIFVKDMIVQSSINGTRVWEEAFEVQSNEDGIYTIMIGQGKITSSINNIKDIGKIDWGNGPFFLNLKIAIAPSIPASWWVAADNYIDLGTTQMMSVPYALFAGNASVTNVTSSIPPGPPNTFLVTDSNHVVSWASPQAANQAVTTVTNFNMNLASGTGQKITIQPNTTSVVIVGLAGVKKGDPIMVAPQGDYQNWQIYSAWVSKDDEVSIRFANYTSSIVDVKGSEYKIVVIK